MSVCPDTKAFCLELLLQNECDDYRLLILLYWTSLLRGTTVDCTCYFYIIRLRCLVRGGVYSTSLCQGHKNGHGIDCGPPKCCHLVCLSLGHCASQGRNFIKMLGDSLNPPQRPRSGSRAHFNSRCLRCRTFWGNIVLLRTKQVGIKFICIYRVSLKI